MYVCVSGEAGMRGNFCHCVCVLLNVGVAVRLCGDQC